MRGQAENVTAREAVFAGLLATVTALAAIALLLVVSSRTGELRERPYVAEFEGATNPADKMAAFGDGQGFSLLARDPLLRHVGPTGPEETAYRAGRPATSYLAWAFALGRRQWVPTGLLLAAAASAGLAAAAMALVAQRMGISRLRLGAALLVVPGAMPSLVNGGSELLALAGIGLAVAMWPHRPWTAVVALTLAALSRESSLVVLPAFALLAPTRRHVTRLALPVVAFGAWVTMVRARYGAWPWEAGEGRLDGPFEGMLGALSRHLSPLDLLHAALFCVVVILLVAHRRRTGSTLAIGTAFAVAVLGVFLGRNVWAAPWENASRALLPAYAFAALCAVERVSGRDVAMWERLVPEKREAARPS